MNRRCLLLPLLAAGLVRRSVQSQTAPPAHATPDERIVVTQQKDNGTGEAKARELLRQMTEAIGGNKRYQRQDYRLEGRTSFFYKNQATGSTEYALFHHPLAGSTFEDRVELTKKHDVVQIWTPTEGFEVTFKGRRDLPKADREAYFQRQQYSLDALLVSWLNDPAAVYIYGGRNLVSRRQADTITVINSKNEGVTLDLEVDSHLPLRRSFQVRNADYKDFDEDVEEYGNWHSETGTPVPYTVSRYLNGDMVSERFIEKIDFRPIDPSLFTADAKLSKHR